MAAQGENACSGTSHVTEKELKDGGRANDLRTFRLLRPTQGIANCSRFFRARRRAKRLGNFQEAVAGHAAKLLNQLRRVSRIMLLQNLIYTSGMAQRGVALAIPEICRACTAVLAVTGIRASAT